MVILGWSEPESRAETQRVYFPSLIYLTVCIDEKLKTVFTQNSRFNYPETTLQSSPHTVHKEAFGAITAPGLCSLTD